MVAAVMNAGCMYLGPALQQQPTARQLGLIAGVEQGTAAKTVRDLLDLQARALADVEEERTINEEWSAGYRKGLALVIAERDV